MRFYRGLLSIGYTYLLITHCVLGNLIIHFNPISIIEYFCVTSTRSNLLMKPYLNNYVWTGAEPRRSPVYGAGKLGKFCDLGWEFFRSVKTLSLHTFITSRFGSSTVQITWVCSLLLAQDCEVTLGVPLYCDGIHLLMSQVAPAAHLKTFDVGRCVPVGYNLK